MIYGIYQGFSLMGAVAGVRTAICAGVRNRFRGADLLNRAHMLQDSVESWQRIPPTGGEPRRSSALPPSEVDRPHAVAPSRTPRCPSAQMRSTQKPRGGFFRTCRGASHRDGSYIARWRGHPATPGPRAASGPARPAPPAGLELRGLLDRELRQRAHAQARRVLDIIERGDGAAGVDVARRHA